MTQFQAHLTLSVKAIISNFLLISGPIKKLDCHDYDFCLIFSLFRLKRFSKDFLEGNEKNVGVCKELSILRWV